MNHAYFLSVVNLVNNIFNFDDSKKQARFSFVCNTKITAAELHAGFLWALYRPYHSLEDYTTWLYLLHTLLFFQFALNVLKRQQLAHEYKKPAYFLTKSSYFYAAAFASLSLSLRAKSEL